MAAGVNAAQAAGWNGPEGQGWADDWEVFDRSLQHYQPKIVEAAAVQDGERVLDVGCGNGQTTRAAGRATPSGSVLGIDLSGPMLARARELTAAEGLANVEYVQADAQVHSFHEGAFDVCISRFGTMFFDDRTAAFTNLARALRPGGRILFVVWQAPSENPQFTTLMGTLAGDRPPPSPIRRWVGRPWSPRGSWTSSTGRCASRSTRGSIRTTPWPSALARR
jgi:ubiquinone/menaquinone biosynthesis C-methylase UbiE